MKTYLLKHIIFCLFVLGGLCLGSCSNDTQNYPMIIISDFGTDVDDAQAIAYLCSNYDKKAANIKGIITVGDIPRVRAQSLEYFLSSIGKNIPIVIGSAFNLQKYPVSEKDSVQMVDNYLKDHLLNGVPFEFSLLNYLKANCHKHKRMIVPVSPIDFIEKQIIRHKGKLEIVILAQATDFARYIALYPNNIKYIKTIAIQGQIYTTPTGMEPNFESYNLRKDSLAAKIIIGLQKQIPMTIVGKYAAYKAQFSREDMTSMGGYISKAADMGIKSLFQRDSILFGKIFRCNNIATLDRGNNPYDLITAMSITDKKLFTPIIYYNGKVEHKIIGNDSINTCIRDASKIKKKFLRVYAAYSPQ